MFLILKRARRSIFVICVYKPNAIRETCAAPAVHDIFWIVVIQETVPFTRCIDIIILLQKFRPGIDIYAVAFDWETVHFRHGHPVILADRFHQPLSRSWLQGLNDGSDLIAFRLGGVVM